MRLAQSATAPKMKKEIKPTPAQMKAFQGMYDYFNVKLFKGELPQCLLNLSRLRGAMGFFSPGRWKDVAGKTLHEISINPEYMRISPKETCQTLVHEMCHLWQQELGKPPRKAYHDKAFAEKMKECGLTPSHNGQPGGKETGQKMADYATPGGVFELWFDKMPKELFFPFEAIPMGEKVKETKKNNKVKYTCPDCGCNAWGKPAISLICGECYINEPEDNETGKPVITFMQAEDSENEE